MPCTCQRCGRELETPMALRQHLRDCTGAADAVETAPQTQLSHTAGPEPGADSGSPVVISEEGDPAQASAASAWTCAACGRDLLNPIALRKHTLVCDPSKTPPKRTEELLEDTPPEQEHARPSGYPRVSLRCFHPRSSAICRIFAFHHAGGAAANFDRMAQQSSSSIELRAVSIDREQDHSTHEESVTALVHNTVELLRRFLDLPFIFFGHSFGAVVALETAWELQKEGSPCPLRVVLSALGSPTDMMSFLGDDWRHDDRPLRDFLELMGGTPIEVESYPYP